LFGLFEVVFHLLTFGNNSETDLKHVLFSLSVYFLIFERPLFSKVFPKAYFLSSEWKLLWRCWFTIHVYQAIDVLSKFGIKINLQILPLKFQFLIKLLQGCLAIKLVVSTIHSASTRKKEVKRSRKNYKEKKWQNQYSGKERETEKC